MSHGSYMHQQPSQIRLLKARVLRNLSHRLGTIVLSQVRPHARVHADGQGSEASRVSPALADHGLARLLEGQHQGAGGGEEGEPGGVVGGGRDGRDALGEDGGEEGGHRGEVVGLVDDG